MTSRAIRAALAALLAAFLSPRVAAADKVLEFDLVTTVIDSKKIDVPNVEKQSVSVATAHGVAVFKDGRSAVKEFVFISDRSKDSLTQVGYSTYTFDDGSTLTLRWTAGFKPGETYHGEYKVLSGTGAYQGATGSGTIERLPDKFPESSGLYRIKLLLKTP